VIRPRRSTVPDDNQSALSNQEEFNLPLYSWYPWRLKRHFEAVAVTTRPALANFARYSAVNFSAPAIAHRVPVRRCGAIGWKTRAVPSVLGCAELRASISLLNWIVSADLCIRELQTSVP
jgi:hypothetical protein